MESGIPLTIGILNPSSTEKDLESSNKNPESTAWNPDTKSWIPLHGAKHYYSWQIVSNRCSWAITVLGKNLLFFLKQHGGKLRDPTTDAEHSIIFNSVFGSCPKKSTLDLRSHFVALSILIVIIKTGTMISPRCGLGES